MPLGTLKGDKRVQAIVELGKDETNAKTLFALIASEKGAAKQAAIQALANFDYLPAKGMWEKLFKSKSKGEKVFLQARSKMICDLIANAFYPWLSSLIEKADGYVLCDKELKDFKTFISLMLAKESDAIEAIYNLVARHSDKLSSFDFTARQKTLRINDYIHFFNPSSEDIKKIFPALLAMSIIKSMDPKLMQLAHKLHETYGKNWLFPLLITELLTKPAKSVYDTFSPYATTQDASYLYDAFGALYFDKKLNKHMALLFWGQYYYGEIDTRFSFSRPLYENLDERWYALLIGQKPEKVTLQVYNRGGVLYEAYDEMFVEILPEKIHDTTIQSALEVYFIAQEKAHNGLSTAYLEAFYRLGMDTDEAVIERYIACKENAVSKYAVRSNINSLTHWSDEKKLAFYAKLPKELVVDEILEALKNR